MFLLVRHEENVIYSKLVNNPFNVLIFCINIYTGKLTISNIDPNKDSKYCIIDRSYIMGRYILYRYCQSDGATSAALG